METLKENVYISSSQEGIKSLRYLGKRKIGKDERVKEQIQTIIELFQSFSEEEELLGIYNSSLKREAGSLQDAIFAWDISISSSFKDYIKFLDLQKLHPQDSLMYEIFNHHKKYAIWRSLIEVESYIAYKEIILRYPKLKTTISYVTVFSSLVDQLKEESEVIDFLEENPKLQWVFQNPTIKLLKNWLYLNQLVNIDKRLWEYMAFETMSLWSDQPTEDYLDSLIQKIKTCKIVLKLCDSDKTIEDFVDNLDIKNSNDILKAINKSKQITNILAKNKEKYPEILNFQYEDKILDYKNMETLSSHISILKRIEGDQNIKDIYMKYIEEWIWSVGDQIRYYDKDQSKKFTPQSPHSED